MSFEKNSSNFSQTAFCRSALGAFILIGLLTVTATNAVALDLATLKSRTIPTEGSYEQAELCSATLLYEAYLIKDDNTVPDHEAWSQKALAGGHLWVLVAYRKSSLYSVTSPDEKSFVKTKIVPAIQVITDMHDYDTFKYYVDYCSRKTDEMTAKSIPN